VDDYGHHPTEIAATIAAAHAAFPRRRIRVLFQPHTFSRTAKYFTAFVEALRTADDVALLHTYGSARETKGGKSSKDLADALGVRHFATHTAALRYYRKDLEPHDMLIVMGAGDGDVLARRLADVK
jgi:UDP-N-acetylmuramate--alanine ligase